MSVANIFGVDLGTTNSVVGVVKNGKVELAVDNAGKRQVASYVAYPPSGKPVFVVGKPARDRMKSNSDGVIYECKRLIGMNYSDPIVEKMKKYVPFQILDDGNNKPQICVKQGDQEIKKYPEEISASILQEMQRIVAKFAGFDMRKAVITVPAYFNQYQRQATKDAGKIAGLDVVAVISEPVAAAYAYADQNDISSDNKEKIIMIYDLGGGTFDVTIMSVTGTKYKELGLDGDLFLGGSDFDTLLMDSIITDFEEQLGTKLTPNQRSKLRFKCEEAKISLKVLLETEIEFGDVDYVLSRSKMDKLLKPMIQRSIEICDGLLKSCNKTAEDIDDIILVGGSSRLNLVHSMLEEHYHKELKESINPDECVAYGATKYGYFLSRGGENNLEDVATPAVSPPIPPTPIADVPPDMPPTCPLPDMPPPPVLPPIVSVKSASPSPQPLMRPIEVDITCPSDIGINVNKKMHVVIPHGQVLPYKNYVVCTNMESFVTQVDVDIYQGKHRHVSRNRKLKTIKINDIEPRPVGKNIFIIYLMMDETGTLSARVVDYDTGNEVECPNIQTNLSDDAISRMQKQLEEEQRAQMESELVMKQMNDFQRELITLMEKETDPDKKQMYSEAYSDASAVVTMEDLQNIKARCGI